jgi:hypothetical protein
MLLLLADESGIERADPRGRDGRLERKVRDLLESAEPRSVTLSAAGGTNTLIGGDAIAAALKAQLGKGPKQLVHDSVRLFLETFPFGCAFPGMHPNVAPENLAMLRVCAFIQELEVGAQGQQIATENTFQVAINAKLSPANLVRVGDDMNVGHVWATSADEIPVEVAPQSHLAVNRPDGQGMQHGSANEHSV